MKSKMNENESEKIRVRRVEPRGLRERASTTHFVEECLEELYLLDLEETLYSVR